MDPRLEQFRKLAARFEIRDDFAAKLRILEGYQIVMLCDDSGSMNTVDHVSGQNAFAPGVSRWDELKYMCSIVVDIASVLDRDGIDVFFLNRMGQTNVFNSDMVANLFVNLPSGSTPLVTALQNIFRTKANSETKLLVLIATDGEPNEGSAALKHLLETRPANTFVSIIACTSDASAVNFLNHLDNVVPCVDVVDDYHSELSQIRTKRGADFKYSFGDHLVKTLLGSILPEFDNVDESDRAIAVPVVPHTVPAQALPPALPQTIAPTQTHADSCCTIQ